MIRNYSLTFNGAAQRLSDVLASAGGAGGPNDLPIRAISLQPGGANGAACYIGGYESPTITSSAYGIRLEPAAAGVPPAPFILGEFSNAPMKLSDFSVIGANNETLKILVVT